MDVKQFIETNRLQSYISPANSRLREHIHILNGQSRETLFHGSTIIVPSDFFVESDNGFLEGYHGFLMKVEPGDLAGEAPDLGTILETRGYALAQHCGDILGGISNSNLYRSLNQFLSRHDPKKAEIRIIPEEWGKTHRVYIKSKEVVIF